MADSHSTLAAIVIAHNEATMIMNCLETLRWCDEVIVIDNHSSDTTAELAARWGARVASGTGGFPELRNLGRTLTKADWILYIDADERVTPSLAKEIRQVIIQPGEVTAWRIVRNNVCYGYHLKHGGWEKDAVVRLFAANSLKTWAGKIHEHAEINGKTAELINPLWHLTHRNVIDGLAKTIAWTPLEAQQLVEAGVPKITGLTLLRKAAMEVIRRLILQHGYRDGMSGVVEAFVQGANRLLVYAQVWELQQKPALPERYATLEQEIAAEWQTTTKIT